MVCNLVARQARSILECPRPSSQVISRTSVTASSTSSVVRKTGSRKVISSFMLDNANQVIQVPPHSLVSSPKMMPPPPPRVKTGLNSTHPGQDVKVQSLQSFPPMLIPGALSEACVSEELNESRTVSFQSAGRGRAYSHSEGNRETCQSQRPRSRSLGICLASTAVSQEHCDTIVEEDEGEFESRNSASKLRSI